MSTVSDRVRDVVVPLVEQAGLALYDLEQRGGSLVVLVDRPDRQGAEDGVDLEALTGLTRALSRALDESDPIAGRYTLEVSSPGLERPLRTPAHFASAVGGQVSVRTLPTEERPRRIQGTLLGADATDDGGIEVDGVDPSGEASLGHLVIPYREIERARTVFEWGPAPKPGGRRGGRRSGATAPSAPRNESQHEVDAT